MTNSPHDQLRSIDMPPRSVAREVIERAIKAHDQLADRLHRYRAYSRGLETLLRQSDTTIPEDVLALNPDGES